MLAESDICDDGMLRSFSQGGMVCASAFPGTFTICPDGTIVNCENIDDDRRYCVGNIDTPEELQPGYYTWRTIPEAEECRDCVYYPCCLGYSCCRGYWERGGGKTEDCKKYFDNLFELAIALHHAENHEEMENENGKIF